MVCSLSHGMVVRGATGAPSASLRVNLVRRSFGFTLLIALWYRPLHEAFERIRRGNFGQQRLQDIAKLFGLDFVRPAMGALVQPDVFLGHLVRSATGGTVAGVVPRDDFARARTMTTTAVPPVDMGTDATLRAVLRQRLGTRDAPGIRALRNDVVVITIPARGENRKGASSRRRGAYGFA